MSNQNGRWRLEGFPTTVGDVPGEVEKAYTTWLTECEINPRRRGERLQGDDIRYTSEVPNGVYADERGGWQLMCDYEVHEPVWSAPGRVVFVEMGFVEGDILSE